MLVGLRPETSIIRYGSCRSSYLGWLGLGQAGPGWPRAHDPGLGRMTGFSSHTAAPHPGASLPCTCSCGGGWVPVSETGQALVCKALFASHLPHWPNKLQGQAWIQWVEKWTPPPAGKSGLVTLQEGQRARVGI